MGSNSKNSEVQWQWAANATTYVAFNV